MDAGDINAVLALVLWCLVAISGPIASRHTGLSRQMLAMWLAFISLATVNVLSSIGFLVPSFLEDTDVLAFWAGFFRATSIVLVAGFVWHGIRE